MASEKKKKRKILLDPAALHVYDHELLAQNRTPEEIRIAKRDYIEGGIANFQNVRGATRTLLVVLGIACLMPPFLILFVPALLGFWFVNRSTHNHLLAAVEIWKDDLGADYPALLEKVKKA
ncbi:MAG: hypothetical protein ABI254_08290 [Chthoniobacterales bacterium]